MLGSCRHVERFAPEREERERAAPSNEFLIERSLSPTNNRHSCIVPPVHMAELKKKCLCSCDYKNRAPFSLRDLLPLVIMREGAILAKKGFYEMKFLVLYIKTELIRFSEGNTSPTINKSIRAIRFSNCSPYFHIKTIEPGSCARGVIRSGALL